MAFRTCATCLDILGVTISIAKDADLGEYRCRIMAPAPARNDNLDYFTDSLEDAIGTAKLMAKEVARYMGIAH